MSATRCPSFEVLSRAFSERRRDVFERHLGSCPICSAAWSDLEVMHGAALALPLPSLEEEAADRIERELVAATRAPAPELGRRSHRPNPVLIAAAAAGVLAFGVFAVFFSSRTEAPPSVVVSPIAEADYERAVRYDGERAVREVVRVRHGRLRLDATGELPLEVVTADARLEGSAFEVVVVDDRLVDVVVRAGTVAVRRSGAAVRILGVGEAWSAAEAVAPEVASAATHVAEVEAPPPAPPRERPVAPVAPIAPAPAPSSTPRDVAPEEVGGPRGIGFDVTPREEPSAPSAAELAFERGWTALRAERFTDAALAFAEVAHDAPNSPFAEDAAYWRAVALVRAEHEDAREALLVFVARYPKGPRAPEVWVLIGWRELAASNFAAAREAFAVGYAEGGPVVRAEAERGLEALGRE